MLGRIHFTIFLKLLDIDILEAPLRNSFCSPCEFADGGNILIQLTDAKHSLLELNLRVLNRLLLDLD